MSLIHDALERARQERDRKAAMERGETPPALPPPPEYRFRSPAWILAAVAAVALAALGVGWMVGRRPAAGGRVSEPLAGEERAIDPGGVETGNPAAAGEDEIGPAGPATGRGGGARERLAADRATERAFSSSATAEAEDAMDRIAAAGAGLAGAGSAGSEADDPGTASGGTITSDSEPDPSRSEEAPNPGADGTDEPASNLPETTRPPGRRTSAQPRATTPESTATDPPFRLSGIAWSESAPLAVIDGALLTVGETIDGWTVAEIRRRSVLLERGEDRVELALAAPATD